MEEEQDELADVGVPVVDAVHPPGISARGAVTYPRQD